MKITLIKLLLSDKEMRRIFLYIWGRIYMNNDWKKEFKEVNKWINKKGIKPRDLFNI